ncbi:hypothetical protein [Streptomyces sparsogenes]|uniref:Secreted protein n=1 Tax=Streptomyces sparsogenes DSM 40356 TaxID=1331668 RepID=A0A1R1SAY6_9ACTN|nr:hypothetical protein [Streptomyces sparsogenes]OMI35392.1 hypothetical protein SPAR_32011 [Streptomyces sparsogenes DSM 40356]
MFRTVLHTVLASALLTLVPAVPSAADTTTSAPRAAGVRADTVPADRSGAAESAFDHVANFYGAYIDARGSASEELGQELRRHYLTADLRRRLAAWEGRHATDGVLRAQGVPTAWKVSYGDSAMGHTWTRVRLAWGTGEHPAYTYLSVRSDLATKRISDIGTTTVQR